MTLENNYVLGTMFPIDIDKIIKKSNEVWGLDPDKYFGDKVTIPYQKLQGQLSFALYTYLGSMHIDVHFHEAVTNSVVQLLNRHGLPKYVKSCSALFDWCARHGSFDFEWTSMTTEEKSEITSILPGDPIWVTFCSWFGHQKASAMQKAWALRYLKRFTVDDALLIKNSCLKQFTLTNKQCRSVDRVPRTSVEREIVSLAKTYIHLLIHDFDYEECERRMVEDWDFYPTPNGVADCCGDPRHRVLYSLANLGYLPTSDTRECYIKGTGKVNFNKTVTVNGVPKSVDKYRTITPINPGDLALQQNIVTGIEKCKGWGLVSPTNIPLHDQEIMRKDVYSSTSGETQWATIDLSAASDTVRLTLARELFPEDFMSLIEGTRPRYFNIKGRVENSILYMLAPMGCGYTLILQSMIFWALDCAICEYCARMAGDTDGLGDPMFVMTLEEGHVYFTSYQQLYETLKVLQEEENINVSSNMIREIWPYAAKAYGDDQQVPQKYAEPIMDMLTRLGFNVNYDKSFFDEDSLFRESCGAEALVGGDPIDGYYFPRHSLSILPKNKIVKVLTDLSVNPNEPFWKDRDKSGEAIQNNSLTSVLHLSKVFWLLGHDHMAELITQWIVRNVPEMTLSEVGTPASDAWGTVEMVHHYKALPMADVVEGEIPFSKLSEYKKTELLRKPIDNTITKTSKLSYRIGRDYYHLRPMHWAISSEKVQLGELGNSCLAPNRCAICKFLKKNPYGVYLSAEILEQYRLQHWLLTGPNYESELDRLLGVSSPTPRLDVISRPKYGSIY